MFSWLPLLFVLVLGGGVAYLLWKFAGNKQSHGIEVVTRETKQNSNRTDLADDPADKEVVAHEAKKTVVVEDHEVKEKLRSEVEQECINQIVENPKDINSYIKLSVFYIQRKKWNDAREVLMEAKKIDPEDDRLQNNIGVVSYHLKRFNNAVMAFEKAIAKNDRIAHRLANMGLALSAMSDYARASEYFSRAVNLDPEQKEYQELLSEAKGMLV